jgi:hypothetical protein
MEAEVDPIAGFIHNKPNISPSQDVFPANIVAAPFEISLRLSHFS